MDNQVHNAIVNFNWEIADDCLRDVYMRGKYRDVILLMTVIRHLYALLEDTKVAVLEMKKLLVPENMETVGHFRRGREAVAWAIEEHQRINA